MGIFEEDDEFAHDGGEGDFGGFATLAQAQVERLEDVHSTVRQSRKKPTPTSRGGSS